MEKNQRSVQNRWGHIHKQYNEQRVEPLWCHTLVCEELFGVMAIVILFFGGQTWAYFDQKVALQRNDMANKKVLKCDVFVFLPAWKFCIILIPTTKTQFDLFR